MNDFTDEDRRMLVDGIEGTLEPGGAAGSSIGGFPKQSAQIWSSLADLGIMALPFSEDYGGLALEWAEVGTVMKSLGRFASVEPYLSNVVLAGGIISRSDDAEIKAALLPAIAAGEIRLAFAFEEMNARGNPDYVGTSAAQRDGSFVLSGHKSVVLDAPGADRLIVTARIEDGSGKGQLSFFLVDRTSPGLTIKEYFTIDGRPAGDVVLDKVTVLGADRISMSADGLVVLERVLDEAALAACWESVGAMERLNELSLEWCKERVAFGQPLSKLQVVQHRLVDMHVAIEHAAAITTSASQRLDGSTLNRAMLVSAAKATVAREGLMIGEAAVQLHGAAGTTEDLDVSRYFKRILTNNMLFGNRDHHVQRYLDIYFANQEAPA